LIRVPKYLFQILFDPRRQYILKTLISYEKNLNPALFFSAVQQNISYHESNLYVF